MTQLPNPYEGKFPRLPLVIWPLIPLSIIAFAYLLEFNGHQFNVHGSFMALAFFTVASAVAAFLFSLFVLPKAIQRLKSNPADKTSLNYVSVGFSIAFDLAFIACAIAFMNS